MTEFLETMETDTFYQPTEAEERDHWSGKGHIEFFVIQNVPGTFEIEYVDYSGCVGGLQDTMGIEYYITDCWCLNEDPDVTLREGVTYTLHGVTVEWTRGDGWEIDDDVEYSFETITSHATLWGYLSHKISMIWWRKIGCHIRNFKQNRRIK